MSTQEIIEKALVNLLVAKTKLELEQQKTTEDKDYWFKAYQEQKDKCEKLESIIGASNKQEKPLLNPGGGSYNIEDER